MGYSIDSIRRKFGEYLRCMKPNNKGNAVIRNFGELRGMKPNNKGNAVKEDQLSLPTEVIWDILSYLPVKSVLRLKCVCRNWRSITEDAVFIHDQAMRAADREIWAVDGVDGHRIQHACQGLILDKHSNGRYRARNPSTNRVLDLPDPIGVQEYRMRLCYYRNAKKFKAVLPFANPKSSGNLSFHTLTVGVDDEWRTIDSPLKCEVLLDGDYKRLADHIVIVLPKAEHGQLCKEEIVIFEVEEEKVWRVSLIPQLLNSAIHIMNWDGKPSVYQRSSDDKRLLNVWIVEDYKKQQWAKEKIVVDMTPLNEDSSGGSLFTPYWFGGNFGSKMLYMHRGFKEYVKFDTVSKSVEPIEPPEKKFVLRPTLMEFKGMKSLLPK